MERLREVADWLRDKLDGPSVLLLASVPNGSPQLLATVSKALTGQGLHAGQLLNEVADTIGGQAGAGRTWPRAVAATVRSSRKGWNGAPGRAGPGRRGVRPGRLTLPSSAPAGPLAPGHPG